MVDKIVNSGKGLKLEIYKKGFNPNLLSKIIGCDRSTVDSWCAGRNYISLKYAHRLHELGIPDGAILDPVNYKEKK